LIGAEGGIFAFTLAVIAVLAAVVNTAKRAPLIAAVMVGVAVAAATLDLVQSPLVWCTIILALSYRRISDPRTAVLAQEESPLRSGPTQNIRRGVANTMVGSSRNTLPPVVRRTQSN
jgi:hypothetical protein